MDDRCRRVATHFEVLRGKVVIYNGSSRPNGVNLFWTSCHAEVLACQYIQTLKNRRNIKIRIWRETSSGVQPAYCCVHCCNFLKKHKLDHAVITTTGSAILDAPVMSRGMYLKLNDSSYCK
jgi:hypothetical protein